MFFKFYRTFFRQKTFSKIIIKFFETYDFSLPLKNKCLKQLYYKFNKRKNFEMDI